MKTLMKSLLIVSVVGFAVPAFAASALNISVSPPQAPETQTVSLSPITIEPRMMQAPPSPPVNLLVGVACQADESRKACDVRISAAQRAVEVVTTETVSVTHVSQKLPYELLIP